MSGFGSAAGRAVVDHAVDRVWGQRDVAVRPAQEVRKSQRVRALDVALLGPATIAAGLYAARPLPKWARFGLVAYGVTTIAYNAYNWIATESGDHG